MIEILVFQNHAFKTNFDSFNICQKFRYHANKTFLSDIRMKMSYSHDFELFERNCMARIMSYSHDIETFERDWMTRNMSYTYFFETHENLSHKQSVLFHEHSRKLIISEKIRLFSFRPWMLEISFTSQMFYFWNQFPSISFKCLFKCEMLNRLPVVFFFRFAGWN